MKMKDTALAIRKEIDIEAPPERVWPYVATQDGCRRWLCNVAEVFDLMLEPRPGGRYEDHMVVKGKTYRSTGEVVTYDPPRQFTYRYRSLLADGSFGPPNTVTITLVPHGPHTRVLLEETGFEQQPEEIRRRYFESNDQGWAASMEDLRAIMVQEVLPALGHLLICQTIEINAPVDRVWRYLATEEGRRERLRLSYPDSHTQRETFEAREGGRWESSGISAHSGDPYRQFGRILTYDAPRRLIFTLQEDGWPAETTVTYQLTEYYGKTRVTLIHSGFEQLPAERRERTRKAYEIGRFKGLERLRDMIEGRAVEVQYPIHIRKEIDLDASIDRVWWYVGTQEGSLRRHAAERVPGETEYQSEVLEPRVGGRYELRGIFQGRPFLIHGQVVAYDPPHGLALTWREEGWPVDTLVTFRLTATAPGKTRLVVIHNGFEHLPPEIRERAVREYEQGRQRGLEAVHRLLAERLPQ
jgi:uncharacterized protein YndB with AHSA1/START domain